MLAFHTWSPPPADLVLQPGEVHVWRAFLDNYASHLADLRSSLSDDERTRAGRFHFERDRVHFAVGRGLIRSILARYLGQEPARLRFEYGSNGKPWLTDPLGRQPLQFNLSHSHGVALFALAFGQELGVDLEQVRLIDDAEQIAKNYYTAREHALLRELSGSRKEEAFFKCWTRKEAYLKATGTGISESLDKVEVSLVPGEPARVLSIAGDIKAASAWQLEELIPASGFVGAVAWQGPPLPMALWQCAE
ncbi:MAG: 4'-phosphopantetheinyl transferase superfamily protein [Verrucomicrobiota bacterium]